jgi:hypothetical protein
MASETSLAEMVGGKVYLHTWITLVADHGWRAGVVSLAVVAGLMHSPEAELRDYLSNSPIISGARLLVSGDDLQIHLLKKYWPDQADKAAPKFQKPEGLLGRTARMTAEARGFRAGLDSIVAQRQRATRKMAPRVLREEPTMPKTEFTREASDQLCEREWDHNPEVRAEFLNLARYQSWTWAERCGRTKIISGRAITVERPARVQ